MAIGDEDESRVTMPMAALAGLAGETFDLGLVKYSRARNALLGALCGCVDRGSTVRKKVRGASRRVIADIWKFPLERGRLSGKWLFFGQLRRQCGGGMWQVPARQTACLMRLVAVLRTVLIFD